MIRAGTSRNSLRRGSHIGSGRPMGVRHRLCLRTSDPPNRLVGSIHGSRHACDRLYPDAAIAFTDPSDSRTRTGRATARDHGSTTARRADSNLRRYTSGRTHDHWGAAEGCARNRDVAIVTSRTQLLARTEYTHADTDANADLNCRNISDSGWRHCCHRGRAAGCVCVFWGGMVLTVVQRFQAP